MWPRRDYAARARGWGAAAGLLALMALCLAPEAALASASDWQTLSPDVRIRLISSDTVDAAGNMRLAIELDMPRTTKTYWKVPGEAGIPAELDLAASVGLEAGAIDWPYPQIDQSAGVTDFAYFGPTVLPFTVKLVSRPALVRAKLMLGICSELCLPAQAELALPLDATTPDPAQGLRISQAMAEVPIAWDGAAAPFSRVELVDGGRALAIQIADPTIEPGSLIVDATALGWLFGAPQKSPESSLVLLPALQAGPPGALGQMDVDVNFLTPDGAFWVSTPVSRGSTP